MRVKNDRSFILCIILSLCTCGIYYCYFIYSVARDTNTICSREDGQNTAGLLVYFLLTVLTCGLYPIYWFYRLAERIAFNAWSQFGIKIKENGTTMVLWYVIGLVWNIVMLVPYYYLIKNLNVLATAYNKRFGHHCGEAVNGGAYGGYSARQSDDGGEKYAD